MILKTTFCHKTLRYTSRLLIITDDSNDWESFYESKAIIIKINS